MSQTGKGESGDGDISHDQRSTANEKNVYHLIRNAYEIIIMMALSVGLWSETCKSR